MTQYAYFDSATADPKPVTGWYDTSALSYPNLPSAAGLFALTSEQWDARMNGQWAISAGALVAYTPPAPPVDTRPAAKAALDISDRTIIRCYEHGVPVPADWVSYRASLRAIVSGSATTTPLPTQPAYPSGT